MNVQPTGILRKVAFAAIGAGVGPALVVLIVWLLSLAGVTMPLHVQAALGVILATLLSLAAGYQTAIIPGEVQIVGVQPPVEVSSPVVNVTETRP